jgi:hypothetical protein
MFRVWQVPNSLTVKIRVEAGGTGCDCAVLTDHMGQALIFSPPDNAIRRELTDNGQAILRDIHRLLPNVRNLAMCDES